jgi:hypothetical protein
LRWRSRSRRRPDGSTGNDGNTARHPAQPPRLSLSDDGIHHVDHRGQAQSIRWQDIRTVWWSEPDYGYLGGMPYWTVSGHGTSIDIDDESIGDGSNELPQWLARKLPGFDAEVVEKAFRRGHFKTDKPEQIERWSRPPTQAG